MSEERTYQGGSMPDLGQLRGYPRGEFLAPLQWPPRLARALGVASHEFVGIKLGGVAGQVVQCELAPSAGHVRLERREVIEHQVQGLSAPVHQLPEQSHEQLPVQGPG